MLPVGGLSNICEQATSGSIVGLDTTSSIGRQCTILPWPDSPLFGQVRGACGSSSSHVRTCHSCAEIGPLGANSSTWYSVGVCLLPSMCLIKTQHDSVCSNGAALQLRPMVLTVMIMVNGADRCVGSSLTRWSITFLRLLCPKSYLPFEVEGCCANIMICCGGAGAQHACCCWSSGKAAIFGSAAERCVELPFQQVVPSQVCCEHMLL